MGTKNAARKTAGIILLLLVSGLISGLLFFNFADFAFWAQATMYQTFPSVYGFLSIIVWIVIAFLGTSIYYLLYFIAVKTDTEHLVAKTGTVVIGVPNVIKAAYILFAGQAPYYEIYTLPKVSGFTAAFLVLVMVFDTIIAGFMLKEDMVGFFTKDKP